MQDWIKHTPGEMPVHPDTVVFARMSNGDELCALPAREIDWDCPGDQVAEYRVVTAATRH